MSMACRLYVNDILCQLDLAEVAIRVNRFLRGGALGTKGVQPPVKPVKPPGAKKTVSTVSLQQARQYGTPRAATRL